MKWWDESWNFITGCTPMSPACDNCYAAREAGTRLAYLARYEGLTHQREDGSHAFNGTVRLHEDLLEQPLRWKRPRSVFVCNTSDLFHENAPSDFINEAWKVMREADWHTFLVLTKRPQRMSKWLETRDVLPNVWMGTTVENQNYAWRAKVLAHETTALRRFISAEPLLGPVSLEPLLDCIDCVIAGGESGQNARPAHPDWVRSLRDQCHEQDVDFVFKQWGEWGPDDDGVNWQPGNEHKFYMFPDGTQMYRHGRRSAGRTLDGHGHDYLPWKELS